MPSLENKTALITCAARGNRKAIAGAFFKKDADVIPKDIDFILLCLRLLLPSCP